MTEPKLYGIERADGSLKGHAFDNQYHASEFAEDTERVVEIVAVKKERLDEVVSALEPFAHFFEQFSKKPISQLDDEFYMIHAGTEWEASLRVSDMKRAAEVLAALRSGR